MPRYRINDPSTGRTLVLEGDSPPTEDELNEIFASTAPEQPPFPQTDYQITPRRPSMFDQIPQDHLLAEPAWEPPMTPSVPPEWPVVSPEENERMFQEDAALHSPWAGIVDVNLPEPEVRGLLTGMLKRAPSDIEVGATQSALGTASSLSSPANVGMLVASLPLGGAPMAVRSAAALGFAGWAAANVPELSRQLGEEFGKPEAERDQAKISRLITDIGTQGGFAVLAGTPGAKSLIDVGKKKGVIPDASRIQETAEVHGDVRPQPVEVKAQVPVQESSAGVLPPEPARPGAGAGEAGDALKMRKLSERGTVAESIPETVQEQIKVAPESFYEPQSMREVEATVRSMTPEELIAVPKDSPIYTASKLEQAQRLFDAGQNDAGYQVFQDLSAELTRHGQVINQAKLLNSLRPEHVVEVVNQTLRRSNRDPLTPDQTTRLEGLAKTRIESQRALDKATDEWLKNPSDENAVSAERALASSNDAALGEQRMVNSFQPRTTASVLKSVLQGNLLTPISEVANIVGNVNFLPFRGASRTGAAMIDVLDAFIRNRPREVSVAPVSGTKAAVEGLVKGVKQIPDIMRYGSGDVVKGETRAGLHPLRAWVKQFAKNPDVPTVDGRIPLSERVNLAIEGTFGVPAETMLRGLGAGDLAFREAARARLISEASRLNKVPKDRQKMAQNFPELFFDQETLARIDAETRSAIFQRHSKTLDHMTSAIKGKGDLADLAVAFVAPYKLTPWNIVGEILSYNPLIAMAKTGVEAKRGNIRAAEMNAAKALTGSMLTYAGWWLYQKGLVAPSMDSRDEQQKARVLANEVLPPNHINVSGLERALKGGDPSFQPNDKTMDIFRAGGLAGSMFYMMANIGRDMETKPETDAAIASLLKNSVLEQARFGLNQSFLKGVASLLDAVREGDADTYTQSLANTVMSVPLPNTLSALGRASREFKPDLKGDTLLDDLGNAVRVRLGGASGLENYLPLKRGLWGEPLRETPESANALVYHFLDITKGKQITADPVNLEIYRLWRKTADTSVIPSPPQKTFTFARETYPLTTGQRSRLTELVGAARRNIMDSIVINPEWHKLSDEAKIRILDSVYRRGLDVGKSQFWQEVQGELVPKPPKAGFKPQ